MSFLYLFSMTVVQSTEARRSLNATFNDTLNFKTMLRKLLTLVSVLLYFSCAFGQTNKIAAFENGLTETKEIIFADSVVPSFNILDRMKFYKVPSVSIAVINNGKIEWAKAYGYADVEDKRLANPTTLYQAASITKSVNAVGIMKLAESGRLSLTKDLRRYLKTWTFPDNEFSKGKTITITNLLSHTAGLNVHGFIGYSTSDSLPTINEILNGQRPANNEAVKPILPPGTQFEYSGGGTTIIRKILDDNISDNYDSLMKRLVLKPLKMENSSFSQPLEKKYKNYAFAYDGKMQVVKGTYYLYPEQIAGGLWTTATDIAKFIIAVQESLNGTKGAILNKEEATEMLTPPLSNSQYALGFGIDEKGGEKYFWHSGESYGFCSLYYGSFNTGKGVVILTNSFPPNGTPLLYEVLNSVAKVYQWKDFYKPVVKKLISVPDTLLNKYAGEYYSENPRIKISIIRKEHDLILTARQSEKMFATGFDTFYVASSPNDNCIFSSSHSDGVFDTFKVIHEGKVIINATKTQ